MFTLKVRFTLNDLTAAKAVLTRRLNHIKSSHRCEALARGLGFRTYATARSLLSEGPIVCQADGKAFHGYLQSHDIAANHRPFYQVIARIALDQVLSREPDLVKHGIGVGSPRRTHDIYVESAAIIERRFAEERAFLRSDNALEPFLLSLALLNRVECTRTIRPDTSSYWIKHIAEEYKCIYSEGGPLGPQYVPNGTLIAAAIHLGFQTKQLRDENGHRLQTVHFNMATKSLNDLNYEIRPSSGRAQDRRRRKIDGAYC
jgi:hypothetical protein